MSETAPANPEPEPEPVSQTKETETAPAPAKETEEQTTPAPAQEEEHPETTKPAVVEQETAPEAPAAPEAQGNEFIETIKTSDFISRIYISQGTQKLTVKDGDSVGEQQIFKMYKNKTQGNWKHDNPIGNKLEKENGGRIDGTIINFTNNEQLTENSVVLVIKCNNDDNDICKQIREFLEKVEETTVEEAPAAQALDKTGHSGPFII